MCVGELLTIISVGELLCGASLHWTRCTLC